MRRTEGGCRAGEPSTRCSSWSLMRMARVIDFTLTDENELVRDAARSFAEREIVPHIRDWDRAEAFPRELFGRMAELGFLGAPIPERYGGSGMDYISFALLCEELERADTAFRVVQSVHVGLNSLALLQWGTEEQRQRWLVPQAKGEKLATFGLTEPGVGTDAGNLATTARRDGERYVLNGSQALDLARGHRRSLPRVRLRRPVEAAQGRDRVPAGAWDARADDRDAPRQARHPGRQHRADHARRCPGPGGAPDRRGGRGIPDRDVSASIRAGTRSPRARSGSPRRASMRRSGTRTSGRRSARRSAVTSS